MFIKSKKLIYLFIFFFLVDVDFDDLSFIDVQLENNYEDDDNSLNMRLSCFLHTLQLSIRDGLKNSTYVPKLLSKCQAFSKASHKSSKIADLLDDLHKRLNRINATRWNSEFFLIKSILSISKDDLESIASIMDNPIRFSNNDFTVLQEFVDVLEPFLEISLKCQAEEMVTASLVIPSIVHLLVHLRDIKNNLLICKKLVQELEKSLNKRFSGIIDRLNLVDTDDNKNFGDLLYFIATVLDPSFRFYWIQDLRLPVQTENRLKESILGMIINEINKDIHQSIVKFSAINAAITTTPDYSSPKIKRRKLFDYGNNINNPTESKTLDPAIELDAYLNDPLRTKFSHYWSYSQLNVLKKLVMKVFSVQASSAPIEHVFSCAGFVLSPRRTNMNEQLFRDLVFLRVNKVLL